MAKNHMKRIAAPNTWDVEKKTTTFITKQSPGPHSNGLSYPMDVLIRDVLKYAKNVSEVKKLLNQNEVKVDGIRRKDYRIPIGIFDTIEFTNSGEAFRITLDRHGKLILAKISRPEASTKPCKITGKTMVRGKIQLNLYDGKNILVESGSYNTGDTVMLSLPNQKISKHIKLDKKSSVFLIGGKHIGESGSVEDVSGNKIIYKDSDGNLVETSKKYAFVVGDSKPLITLK
jgi:small subunit ribosomal protein S4e